MYSYHIPSARSQSGIRPYATFVPRPLSAMSEQTTLAVSVPDAIVTSISGLADPTVQTVGTKPNIPDVIDYFDATVRVRATVTVPTPKIDFLARLDPPDQPTWWKRLSEDPTKVISNVRVTIELVQVGKTLFPFSNYKNSILVAQALKNYLLRIHYKRISCGGFVTAIGGGFLITTKDDIEKQLGIKGQLDNLLKLAKIKLPMSPVDQNSYFWLLYATFPNELRKYVIPEDRVVVDQFEFDKSTLTNKHVGQILAIARHSVALSKAIAPPKIALTGHTDSRGKEKYNEGLGDRRIAAVKEALLKAIDAIKPGLSSQITIETKSFGETKPLIKATTESQHGQNRRVEVLIAKPRPRCPRLSLRSSVDRALKVAPLLSTPEQVKRITCLLRKIAQRGSDDRWVYAGLAQDVYNQDRAFGTYQFSLLRDTLSMRSNFGPEATDAYIRKNLEYIDEQIIAGIGKVTSLMERLKLAASQGLPLISKMKAMDALRAWMHERVQDDKSIYSCYRNV